MNYENLMLLVSRVGDNEERPSRGFCALSGALVLLALQFLTPMFYYIPDAALAAVIIMAVIDMINFSMVAHLWRINSTSASYTELFLSVCLSVCLVSK